MYTLKHLETSHKRPALWFKGLLRRYGLQSLKVSAHAVERPSNHPDQDAAFRRLLLRVLNDREGRFVGNLDETAVQTSYQPARMVVRKGQKRAACKGPEQPKARIPGVSLCGADGRI